MKPEWIDDSEMSEADRVANFMARSKQVGGDHYAKHEIQPWDVIENYGLDFFTGNVLKYLLREKDNRLQDLQKAAHYLEKAIERESQS